MDRVRHAEFRAARAGACIISPNAAVAGHTQDEALPHTCPTRAFRLAQRVQDGLVARKLGLTHEVMDLGPIASQGRPMRRTGTSTPTAEDAAKINTLYPT